MFIICDQVNIDGYPYISDNLSDTVFIGNIKPYKRFIRYETIKQSAKRFSTNFNNEVAQVFGLDNDKRFYFNGSFSNRRWNQLSTNFKFRATILFEYLNNKKTFSIHKDSKVLIDIQGYRDIFTFLEHNKCTFYVYKENCDWISHLQI